MNSYHEPDLEDVLQDDELRRLAAVLTSARRVEPPLDEAFRTGLRRQLMQEAWAMSEGRDSWWRRLFAPPGLAWAGAAVGLLLIASAVVYMAGQPAGGLQQVVVQSSLDGKSSVPLQAPILVSFNQPMDHPTTEQAVQITPATSVAFSWAANTLAVLPTGGTLAPNTQYQVTIGPGARTATGQQLAAPQTITFVTQPPTPTPTPIPTPRPSPANPLNEKQLTSLSGATALAAQWSADSTSVYFADGKGALDLISVKGGPVTVIAPDGVTSPSISPAGDRIAYIRGGKIEVLTFAAGKTDEITPTPTPRLVGWAKDKVIWATGDGIYTQGDKTARQLTPLPTSGVVTILSIAPDGTHAVYRQDQNLFVLDLGTGKSAQLGQANASFVGWSPSGTLLLYSTTDHTVAADTQGATQWTLLLGEASWSSQDAILLGSDTDLYQVRPDGYGGPVRLSNGTYHSPLWAPNATSFVFVRGGALWVGTAPPLPPEPSVVDQAGTVVTNFMDARLKTQSDLATTMLDDNGKKAYATGGLSLTIAGDPRFSRYYVLTREAVGTQPDTVRFVVRLVLAHGKIDVSSYEETLTVVRDSTSRNFLIDQATAGAHLDLGKGAEVVNVDVATDTVKVTFDSDLDPGTISDGVLILDAKGKQLESTAAYGNRVVTLSGLDLKDGKQYRLVVLTTVRDVLGHNVAAEYDLDMVGPAATKHGDHHETVTPSPSPAPSASPTPAG